MKQLQSVLATAVVALLLGAVLVGCGSSGGSDDASSDPTSTTLQADGSSNQSTDTTEAGDAGDDGGDAAEAPADGVKPADGAADPDHTITVSDGKFSPGTLTIKVGEKVTFVGGDDGIYGVIVGSLDGLTVNKGLTETFEFSKAGTYPVEEDINGFTATITVE